MGHLVLLFLIIGIFDAIEGVTNKIFCFYQSYNIHDRIGPTKVPIESIDPMLCTHIYYSFFGITAEGDVRTIDEDFDPNTFERFYALKKRNPKVKLLVSIGGFSEGSINFSKVANSPMLRARFVTNVIEFLLENRLDGVDIDWEYPGLRGGNYSSDREAFVELLRDLNVATGANRLILTATVGAGESLLLISYNALEISENVDFINIMTYDYHDGIADRYIGHNSPLYANSKEPDVTLNVNASIHLWMSNGADHYKINLGIGLYGRSFTLSNPNRFRPQDSAVGPGQPGRFTQEAGYIIYPEICLLQKQQVWDVYWQNEEKCPYMVRGRQWIGYDNVRSVSLKARYAQMNNLAGVFVWALDTDDVNNLCKKGKYPLLRRLKRIIRF